MSVVLKLSLLTIMWSMSLIPSRFPAEQSRSVTSRSAALASKFPLG